MPTPASGYTFEGWYDGDVKIATVPNSPNKTIIAKFKESSFIKDLSFIIVGADGYIITPFGVKKVGSRNWNTIAYANGKYIAFGDGGYVSTSTDGINWTIPGQTKDELRKVITATLNGVCAISYSLLQVKSEH